MSIKDSIVEYWDRLPCGHWHSKNSIDTIAYSNDLLDRRIKVVDDKNFQSQFIKWSDWENKKVLEIGCGVGTDGVRFSMAGAKYTGIDISKNAIEIAKKRFEILGLNGQFYTADGTEENTKLDTSSYDLVYIWGVIHHWPDPRGFIDTAKKYLKPNGCLIFMVYAKDSWQHILSRNNLARFEAQDNCPYIDFYDIEKIKNLLHDDFLLDAVLRGGIFKYNVEKYKQHILEQEPWFEAMPDSLMSVLEKELGLAFLVKSHLVNKIVKNAPS